MNLLVFTILASFFMTGALWASPTSPSQAVSVHTYKQMNYYVLPESKTLLLENPIRVDVSIISKRPETGYYVNIYGQIDDSLRPEITEIKHANPGYNTNFLSPTSLEKVTVDLGVGPALDVQVSSGGGIFFQAAEFLSQTDGDTLIANYKAGHILKIEVVANAKAPTYTTSDQATVDYQETCQRLKDGSPKTNVAGAVNSLVNLFLSNQFRSQGQELKLKLVESILRHCVSVGDPGSLKLSEWPKAHVQFLDGQGAEDVTVHSLEYVSNFRNWNVDVEVSTP